MRDRDEGFKDMLLLEAVRYIGRVETKYEKREREKMQFIAAVYIYKCIVQVTCTKEGAMLLFFSFAGRTAGREGMLFCPAPTLAAAASGSFYNQHFLFLFFYDKATN